MPHHRPSQNLVLISQLYIDYSFQQWASTTNTPIFKKLLMPNKHTYKQMVIYGLEKKTQT
jgi:hypothetical protein